MKKSYNIKYDQKDTSIYDSYIATKSHSQIISNILNGVLGYESKAHIAYGPYGTGKSYISTILTNLLSREISKKNLSKIKSEFSWYDKTIELKINELDNNKIKYLPIILNGYEKDFGDAILRQLSKTLDDYKIRYLTKKSLVVIRNFIELWESDYEETYSKFKNFLKFNEVDQSSFLKRIEVDTELFNSFLFFYRNVTSGAELSLYKTDDLIDVLDELKEILHEKKLGLFIIYDEFGRYLQNLESNEISKFFGQMQNLAELSNKSKNISLLLITHKPVNYYFRNLSNEQKLEYEKIEKRFTVNEIKSDISTFVKVAIDTTKKMNLTCDEIYTQYHIEKVKLIDLFDNNFIANNSLEEIIRTIYPIHPLTLYLLPKFSSIFGQNERTLFTFLQDYSGTGLLGYLNSNSNVYTPELLVDYFFSGSEDEYSEGLKDVRLFKKIYQSLNLLFKDKVLIDSQRILKFILIWNITKSFNVALLNAELIHYALNIDLKEVKDIINILQIEKVIRKNLLHNNYEIIESSGVNLNKLISKTLLPIVNRDSICDYTLNKYYSYKYLYPDNFNAIHDTIRFIRVSLFIGKIKTLDNNRDFQISVSLSNHAYENSSFDTLTGYMFINNIEDYKDMLLNIYAIDQLLEDEKMLNMYKNLDIDLEYEKNQILVNLNGLYSNVFSQNTKFVFNGEVLKFTNINEVLKFAEQRIIELYNRTLIIHNDQINKFILTKQQENAIIQLIGDILEYGSTDFQLDEKLNGPKVLIKYSLDKSSNLHLILNDVRSYLKNNENGKFSDLTSKLSKRPYGIRPTLTSLIVVYALIEYWKNLMFFKDGDFIPSLKSNYIYQIGLGNYDCVYNFSNFDFDNEEFLLSLLEIFGNYEENLMDKSLGIKVCSSIYNWFIDLPIITQLDRIGEDSVDNFLRLVELTKTNPRDTLIKINNEFSLDEIKLIKERVSCYFNEYLKKLELDILNDLGIKSWKDWVSNLDDAILRTEKLAIISKNSQNVLLDYSKTFEKLDIKKWPKSMFEVLKKNIVNDFLLIMNKTKISSIIIDNVEYRIQDVDLSNKANQLLRNISSQISANQKYLSRPEIEKMVILLLKETIK